MTIETAIFLGAGASKADGAPLQGELFYDYFASESFKKSHDEMDLELRQFFVDMFGIDVLHDNLKEINFPTFEEVFGLTDLAILRKEAFKNYDLENRARNSGRLRFMAQYLVFLVAMVLESKLKSNYTIHNKLVQTLTNEGEIKNVAFISTNYDILIDNALTSQYWEGVEIDYGVNFRNFERKDDWTPPRPENRIYLFKPHGSLNWLYCPACNEIELTPKEKGVVTRLIKYTKVGASCQECQSVYMPLIVPPTFYKDLNNAILSAIWKQADNVLRKVNHVIFCGYSFPDADMHIKYLLKRIQTNRNAPSLRFTVINHFSGKIERNCEDETHRFKRFLGNQVLYTKLSFEDFANNPLYTIRG